MKIFALIKQVPDTETKIRVTGDKSDIERSDIKWIVSPYDEFAIEYAIRTKETAKEGTVTAVSVGPERVAEALRTALAMGADHAIHIKTDQQNTDPLLVAKALSEVLKKESFDLAFCGKQAIDADQAAVFGILAEFLNVPFASVVSNTELAPDKKTIRVHAEVEGGTKYKIELPTPSLIAMTKAEHTPRYASLPGIMKAKKKEIASFALADLVGGLAPSTADSDFTLPPERQAGKKIEGEPAQQVKELVRLLREEAKVL